MASKFINITLKIWRQKNTHAKGGIETYSLEKVSTDSSFLEMLDQLNEQLINEQQADVVFFTGDIVNDRSDELVPWMDLFSQIKAPMGVFSTLGNHDYGDYVPWPTPEAKRKNLSDLISYHKEMGWDILNDEHRVLEKDGQKLTIVGAKYDLDDGVVTLM